MIVVIGSFRLPAHNLEAGREAMARVIVASRAEAGCLGYAYAEDVLDPGIFRVSEAWASRTALTAHFGMPHMTQWQREREALGMTGREVTAYEVSGEEPL